MSTINYIENLRTMLESEHDVDGLFDAIDKTLSNLLALGDDFNEK